MIKLALLGHGSFAQPSFDLLKTKYQIVPEPEADCLIVANYGKILKQNQIDKCQFGAINIHGSWLPQYRGSTPIQTAIASGDNTTGITIIKMDNLVDHGDILAQIKVEIEPHETTEELRAKMGKMVAPLFLETLEKYLTHKLKLKPQDHTQATFTQKASVNTTTLKYDSPPQQLYNYYRAYKDEPGFFVELSDKSKLKIIQANYKNDCFVPEMVQKPGKKIVSYRDFLLGFRHNPPFNVDTE